MAYSVDELVKASGIGRTKLYSEIQTGRLRVRKVGTRTVILAEDAQDWIRAQPSERRP